MKLRKLKRDTSTKDALDFLVKKHAAYFQPNVIDLSQIESTCIRITELIEKLKMGLMDNMRKSQMEDVE